MTSSFKGKDKNRLVLCIGSCTDVRRVPNTDEQEYKKKQEIETFETGISNHDLPKYFSIACNDGGRLECDFVNINIINVLCMDEHQADTWVDGLNELICMHSYCRANRCFDFNERLLQCYACLCAEGSALGQ
eukprot:UC4_evm1s1366